MNNNDNIHWSGYPHHRYPSIKVACPGESALPLPKQKETNAGYWHISQRKLDGIDSGRTITSHSIFTGLCSRGLGRPAKLLTFRSKLEQSRDCSGRDEIAQIQKVAKSSLLNRHALDKQSTDLKLRQTRQENLRGQTMLHPIRNDGPLDTDIIAGNQGQHTFVSQKRVAPVKPPDDDIAVNDQASLPLPSLMSTNASTTRADTDERVYDSRLTYRKDQSKKQSEVALPIRGSKSVSISPRSSSKQLSKPFNKAARKDRRSRTSSTSRLGSRPQEISPIYSSREFYRETKNRLSVQGEPTSTSAPSALSSTSSGPKITEKVTRTSFIDMDHAGVSRMASRGHSQKRSAYCDAKTMVVHTSYARPTPQSRLEASLDHAIIQGDDNSISTQYVPLVGVEVDQPSSQEADPAMPQMSSHSGGLDGEASVNQATSDNWQSGILMNGQRSRTDPVSTTNPRQIHGKPVQRASRKSLAWIRRPTLRPDGEANGENNLDFYRKERLPDKESGKHFWDSPASGTASHLTSPRSSSHVIYFDTPHEPWEPSQEPPNRVKTTPVLGNNVKLSKITEASSIKEPEFMDRDDTHTVSTIPSQREATKRTKGTILEDRASTLDPLTIITRHDAAKAAEVSKSTDAMIAELSSLLEKRNDETKTETKPEIQENQSARPEEKSSQRWQKALPLQQNPSGKPITTMTLPQSPRSSQLIAPQTPLSPSLGVPSRCDNQCPFLPSEIPKSRPPFYRAPKHLLAEDTGIQNINNSNYLTIPQTRPSSAISISINMQKPKPTAEYERSADTRPVEIVADPMKKLSLPSLGDMKRPLAEHSHHRRACRLAHDSHRSRTHKVSRSVSSYSGRIPSNGSCHSELSMTTFDTNTEHVDHPPYSKRKLFQGLQIAFAAASDRQINTFIANALGFDVRGILASLSPLEDIGLKKLKVLAKRRRHSSKLKTKVKRHGTRKYEP